MHSDNYIGFGRSKAPSPTSSLYYFDKDITYSSYETNRKQKNEIQC